MMQQIQLLSANASLFRLMRDNGMRVKDVDMLDLVLEADEMSRNGEQKTYIVQKLADKYQISVRNVYLAIKRLHSEIKI